MYETTTYAEAAAGPAIAAKRRRLIEQGHNANEQAAAYSAAAAALEALSAFSGGDGSIWEATIADEIARLKAASREFDGEARFAFQQARATK